MMNRVRVASLPPLLTTGDKMNKLRQRIANKKLGLKVENKPDSSWKVIDIKAYLLNNDIDFDNVTKKADLLKLV